MKTFWTNEYVACMQTVVPELENIYIYIKMHTTLNFPHLERWSEDQKYMRNLSEFDEAQCVC